MTLGVRLKEVRQKKGWSLRQLSRISGVSNGTISLLETDQQSNPTADTINKLAQALGVSSDFLYGRTDDPRPYHEITSKDSSSPSDDPEKEFEKFGDLTIDGEEIELYRKIKKEEEEAATIEPELTPEELQEIEDDKILASVEMMAAHMDEDAYGKPFSRETKHLIANAMREVERLYGKKKKE